MIDLFREFLKRRIKSGIIMQLAYLLLVLKIKLSKCKSVYCLFPFLNNKPSYITTINKN